MVRWRVIDLMRLWSEFRVAASKQPLSQELRTLGFRKLSARLHHVCAHGLMHADQRALV
ncbi:hypothetical protein J2848_007005 [Azospirillum lipoferum]|uniref:hypothetical protein n=1 Tax=Azospirillum TaxID=191 RepID=UPI0014783A1F|nr:MULTISPECIES: hypothetical protein [Azospirillum]MCP1615292.1 hypothetical protein [Azospirillum lipoferum]MDW5534022.1 hypothetical protein [Azospirillum sp. NL1]